ncbi:hypothetical protein TrVE_jg8483 [Triparma verrucosa]|uniref:MRG domain-containing protein n=1 Tax=Triparma verrucosa TaxID=1606542 RepID=A0A9W7EWI8_9STRA|nr:hypothetical protein TrVE_jg8483 [Triparma verrucosa]
MSANFVSGEKCWARENGSLYPATIRKSLTKDSQSRYFIHYTGWNVRWDKWVQTVDLLKDTQQTRVLVDMVAEKKKAMGKKRKEMEKGSQQQQEQQQKEANKSKETNDAQEETPDAIGLQKERAEKRKRLHMKRNNLASPELLDPFVALNPSANSDPPSVPLPLPYSLKKELVDDWMNINGGENHSPQNAKSLKLPSSPTVESILQSFLSTRTSDLPEWSSFITGLTLYFNKSLPLLLLYPSERSTHPSTLPSKTYGRSHLLRLFLKLPYLLRSTGSVSEGEVKVLVTRAGEIVRWLSREESKEEYV